MNKEQIIKIHKDVTSLLSGQSDKDKAELFEALRIVLGKTTVEHKLPVKYIGHRNTYADGIYGTGIYVKDETKLVPANVARQMFKHKDVYVNGKENEVQSVVDEVKVEDKTEDKDNPVEVQDAIDSVMNMREKDSILEFAATQFSNVKLDKRFTLDNLQQETIEMIHKYGLT